MNKPTQTVKKTDKLQLLIDWWIDGLVARDIPMLENIVTMAGHEELTEACKHAQARGARLVKRIRARLP